MTQPLNRMRQNEKNRHKNRPCKQVLKVMLRGKIFRAANKRGTETNDKMSQQFDRWKQVCTKRKPTLRLTMS